MYGARRKAILFAAVGGIGLTIRAQAATNASWLAPVDSSWTDATAWSTNPFYPNNGLPNPADLYYVQIGAAGSPYTISLNSDISIGSLLLNSSDATLSQTAGTLQLVDGGGTIAAGNYNLAGGTLNSADPFTIASQMTWTDGTLAGFGGIKVAAAGSLNIGAGGVARTLSTSFNNSGITNFTDGNLILSNGTLNNQSSGVLNLSGSTNFLIGTGSNNLINNTGTINVNNAMTWSAPLQNSGTINVAAGGSLSFSGSTHQLSGATITGPGFVELGGQSVDGTLTLAGSNMNFSGGTLTGTGDVNVTGNFNWNSGTITGSVGHSAAAINLLPGASMSLLFTSGGSHNLAHVLNNSGTFNFNFETLNCFNNFNNLPGGVINGHGGTLTVNFGGSFVNSGLINQSNSSIFTIIGGVNAGTLNAGTGTIIGGMTYRNGSVLKGAGTIEMDGSTVSGIVDSSVANLNIGSVTSTGTINLNAGTLSFPPFDGGILLGTGTINVAPGAAIVDNFGTFSGTINNSGTLAGTSGGFSSGTFTINLNNGTINNLAHGVITAVPRATGLGTSNFVYNSGTIAIDTGSLSNTGTFNVPMINSGTISATGSGTFLLSSFMNFSGAGFVQNQGAFITSTTPARINLGASLNTTQTFSGDTTIAGVVSMSTGTLTGPGDINVVGDLGIGTVNVLGPGAINVAQGATLSVAQSGQNFSRDINNLGSVNAGMNFTNATLTSSGTITASVLNLTNTISSSSGTVQIGQGSLNASLGITTATFNNTGTVVLGNSTIFTSITLNNGTFNNNGTLLLFNHSSLTQNSAPTIGFLNNGTILATAGTFNTISIGALNNSGTILNQAAGTLSLTGNSISYNGNAYVGGPGTVDFSGNQTVASGVLTLGGTRIRMSSGTISNSGAITVTGSLNWIGTRVTGPGTLTVAAGGSVNFSSSLISLVSDEMLNFGVTTFTTGAPSISGGTLVNGSTGVMSMPVSFAIPNTNSAFFNSGTINANPGATGSVSLIGPFTNDGTLIIQTGTLALGPTVALNSGAYLTGAGTIDISSISFGSLTVNGATTFAGSNIRQNNSITGPGNIDITGTFNWLSGGTSGAGTLGIASGATMNVLLGNAVLSRQLNNAGSINFVGGTLTLSAGTINNLAAGVINIGTTGISGGGAPSQVINNGIINVDPSPRSFTWSSPMTSSGAINVKSGTLLFGNGTRTWTGAATIANQGFVDLGISSLSANILNGTLNLSGGSFALDAGSMSGRGTMVLNNSLTWSGGAISNLTVNPSAAVVIPSTSTGFLVSELDNHGRVDVNATLDLSEATLRNLSDGVLNLSASTPFDFDSDSDNAVTNAGTVNIPAGKSVTLSGAWTNSGTINAVGTLNFTTALNENTGAVVTGPGRINFGSFAQVLDGTTTFDGSNMVLTGSILGTGNMQLTGTLLDGGLIAGQGTVTISSTGRLNANVGTLSRSLMSTGVIDLGNSGLKLQNGTIDNQAGGVVIATGPSTLTTVSGVAGSSNRFVTAGSLSVAAQTLSIAVPFSNSGTIDVSGGGTLVLSSSVSQVVGPTLTHGTWATHTNSTLSIPTTAITNNAANILLDGPGSSFDAINPIANNSGTFQITGGRDFATSASYTNSGRTVVGVSSALTIHGDLTNTGTTDTGGLVIVDYSGASPLATIAAQIASGYANGAWNGIGIDSTPASMHPGAGLAYAEASELGIVGAGTFDGRAVDDTSIIVQYTLAGDSNLDGIVNALDFNAVASNFGAPSSDWTDGDFNYDGTVNTADFMALAGNFGAPLSAPLPGVLVPEPVLPGVIGVTMLLLARRRRQGRSAECSPMVAASTMASPPRFVAPRARMM